MNFDLTDSDLQRLSDDELIAFARAAREVGETTPARRALALLVHGFAPDLTRRVAMRVPSRFVDDVAHDALVRAIAAAFDGHSVGQFRSWLNTIVDRTVADHYRVASRRPRESSLPGEHADEEDSWGDEPTEASESGAVELRLMVDAVLESFNPVHRQVIDLHVFDGYPAREVCDRIEGMSEDNVAKIASRFRAQLRTQLEDER